MNQNTVTGDYININLRQLGATSIKEFNSIMHIAEFDLGDGLLFLMFLILHDIINTFYSVCSHMPWFMVNSPAIRKLSILLQPT